MASYALQERMKTFVFFDCETTGLPSKKDLPNMTQLSFRSLSEKELKSKSSAGELKKLHVSFNPEKPISEKASELTGLTNDDLRDCPTFSEKAVEIVAYLTLLPKPVCLIAHNGNRFDFPILARQLREAGQISELGSIKCADSLKILKELIEFGPYNQPDLYRRFVSSNLPPNTHTAHVDTRMLLELVQAEDVDTSTFVDRCNESARYLKEF